MQPVRNKPKEIFFTYEVKKYKRIRRKFDTDVGRSTAMQHHVHTKAMTSDTYL